jgi:hypothetical protein
MRVTDYLIPKVMIDITDSLANRRGTDMPDMERFSDIRTYIVDDDSFLSLSFLRMQESMALIIGT